MDDITGGIEDLVDQLSGVSITGEDPGKRTTPAGSLPIGFAGLVSASLAAAATQVFDVPIKTAFRPDRLVLSVVAQACDVNDIIIGTVRLNVGSQAVPGNCFSQDAVGTQLRCAVTASPSVFPQVSVTNPTAAAIVVKGGFFGPMKRV